MELPGLATFPGKHARMVLSLVLTIIDLKK
jgi:hypothetical protein